VWSQVQILSSRQAESLKIERFSGFFILKRCQFIGISDKMIKDPEWQGHSGFLFPAENVIRIIHILSSRLSENWFVKTNHFFVFTSEPNNV
jgi:hypothetical protein